jgi:hypothetical protein
VSGTYWLAHLPINQQGKHISFKTLTQRKWFESIHDFIFRKIDLTDRFGHKTEITGLEKQAKNASETLKYRSIHLLKWYSLWVNSYFQAGLFIGWLTENKHKSARLSIIASYESSSKRCHIAQFMNRSSDFREMSGRVNIQNERKYLLKRQRWRSGFRVRCWDKRLEKLIGIVSVQTPRFQSVARVLSATTFLYRRNADQFISA